MPNNGNGYVKMTVRILVGVVIAGVITVLSTLDAKVCDNDRLSRERDEKIYECIRTNNKDVQIKFDTLLSKLSSIAEKQTELMTNQRFILKKIEAQ